MADVLDSATSPLEALAHAAALLPGVTRAAVEGGELVVLCADGLFPGEESVASRLRFISSWADLVDPSAPLFLRRGELREMAGETVAAAADFARCGELAEVTADQQLEFLQRLECARHRVLGAFLLVRESFRPVPGLPICV